MRHGCTCSFNNVEAVDALLLHGFPKEAVDSLGRTPLHAAAWCGSVECVKYLLDRSCNINSTYDLNSQNFVLLLVENDLYRTNSAKEIHSRRGVSIAKLSKTQIEYIYKVSRVPLIDHSTRHRIGTVSVGGDHLVYASDSDDFTPFHCAIQGKNYILTNLFLERGARLDVVQGDGANFLHIAARWSSAKVMNVLKSAQNSRIDIRTTDNEGATPLSRLREQIKPVLEGMPVCVSKPGVEEVKAFESLLRDIRDRAIAIGNERLEAIISKLREEDFDTIRRELQMLREEKKMAKIDWKVESFRVVELQIRIWLNRRSKHWKISWMHR